MVIGRYRPQIGGTEIQAERLAHALVGKGVTVEVLTGRERGLTPYERHDGVSIRRLWVPDVGLPVLNAVALGVGLYRAVLRYHARFDILHVHQALYPAYASIAAADCRGKPSIVKIANTGERFDLEVLSGQAGPLGRHAAQFVADHANSFVALNNQIAAELQSWDVSEDRIVRIPNGVDVPPERSPGTKQAYRKRLDLPVDKPLVVCVGRLHPKKNPSLLISALHRLAQKERTQNLALLGDGPLRPELERQAKEFDLRDRIIFRGQVTNVLDYLYAADLFALPSLMEGLSNALLEAMSVGLPCVVSDIPGNRAVIQSGINGVLFESDNAEQLAGAIDKLLTGEAWAASLGRKARETVEAQYSIDSVADRYIAKYRELLG
jgi:glycosyltransferase involved in cell wall biosynthesis